MDVLFETRLPLPEGHTAVVRLERALRGDTRLVDTIVDLDLQSFVEATSPRAVAEVALHHGRVFVLTIDGDPVGTALCLRDWVAADECVLASVSLLPGWRGRGLGVRFVQWVVEALAAEQVRAVMLHVSPTDRRALAMYQDAGFDAVEGPADAPVVVLRRPLSSAAGAA